MLGGGGGGVLACLLALLSVISALRLLAFMVSLDLRITAGWSPALLDPSFRTGYKHGTFRKGRQEQTAVSNNVRQGSDFPQ